ncbi:MAG: lyase family protein, partial [Planctomycetota bacterium]
MTQKPWEHAKSSGSEGDPLAARFVSSLDYDKRLYKHDIAGSVAHARMLRHVDLITDDDLAAIERGLKEIESEIDEQGDAWPGWKVELEDVHMCIEAALIEKAGDSGRKLHTGRSRNDQVATDIKMWIWSAINETGGMYSRIETLHRAFIGLAERDGLIVMPSYTHLQRAQPIIVGGEILAWCEALAYCRERFVTCSTFHEEYALGSGAIAGSSLPLDRFHYHEALSVGPPLMNSIFATAELDHHNDFVFALTMTSHWLSRWAEQWIIY